jgi:hypothetical protein
VLQVVSDFLTPFDGELSQPSQPSQHSTYPCRVFSALRCCTFRGAATAQPAAMSRVGLPEKHDSCLLCCKHHQQAAAGHPGYLAQINVGTDRFRPAMMLPACIANVLAVDVQSPAHHASTNPLYVCLDCCRRGFLPGSSQPPCNHIHIQDGFHSPP